MDEQTVEVRVVLRDADGDHMRRFKQVIGMPAAPGPDMVLVLGEGEDIYELDLDSMTMEGDNGRTRLWYFNSKRMWIATERLTEDDDFLEADEQAGELLAAGFNEVEVAQGELFW